jgi:hypothetical protein
MDKLDQRIAELRTERAAIDARIEALQGDRDRLDFRLEGLMEAAALRPLFLVGAGASLPSEQSAAITAPRKQRGGRQPGTITGPWKRTLVAWYLRDPEGHGLDNATVLEIARQCGVRGNDHSIRDRIRKYRDDRHLIESAPGGNRVKAETYERFRPHGSSNVEDQEPAAAMNPEMDPVMDGVE